MKTLFLPTLIAVLVGAALPASAGAADASPTAMAPTTLDALPWNAPWAQLAPREKDVVRSSYESLGEADEPPYPVDGLGPILKPLSDAARNIRAEGRVDAIVEVGPDGRARSVSVFRSPEPNLFTPLVTGLLLRQAYKPALCKGQPCAMPFALRVDIRR